LFVLRHAKSSWDDPTLEDHERPLSGRGRRAVKLLAQHVRAAKIDPAQILCSSSRRTLETVEGVFPGCEAVVDPELYSANCAQLIERLSGVPADLPSVLIVGHNPALQLLVLKLVGAPSSGMVGSGSQLADIARKFPTGALATLSFECGWADIGKGCAQLTDYVRPKSLA
jgi:phosphohistidine phosphatase